MQHANVQPKLMRLEQAGAVLGVSHWTLRLWARQGRLRTVKLGTLRLVPAGELDRIVKHGIGRTRRKEQKHERTA
jgi:excisionase family DNA binding protein